MAGCSVAGMGLNPSRKIGLCLGIGTSIVRGSCAQWRTQLCSSTVLSMSCSKWRPAWVSHAQHGTWGTHGLHGAHMGGIFVYCASQ